jgi:hypothetical protein
MVKLVLLPFLNLVVAALKGSVCKSFPYVDLLFLADYPPAEAFCLEYYPPSQEANKEAVAREEPRLVIQAVATVTEVVWVTIASTATANAKIARTAKCTGTCSVWWSCTKQGGTFLSTLCSCIEPPATITTVPTTTTTTVTSTTTS